MKYSVIIPAYNAEKTLRRCLDSLVGQVGDETEILLINDGSADGTEDICREYAEKYPEIRFVSKPNGGVSSARNMGLELAKGEYILFVDADDYVRWDYFAVLDEALQCSPDLLMFRKRLINRRKVYLDCCNCSQLQKDRLETARFISRHLRKQELNLITTKAFRREIIETRGLRFEERLDIGEDKVFAFAFSLYAESVKSIAAQLYNLSLEDKESLSRRKRDDLCESALLEHRLMAELLNDSDAAEDCKKVYRNALSFSFYRSAYTVVGELRKFDLRKKERVSKAREILDLYSRESGFKADDLLCKCIALPVQKKHADLIDSAVCFFVKRSRL